jgi:uncharacterized NAD(P)/FAD-binding protein YdhS
MNKNRIGLVGSGPAGIYTLRHLLDIAHPLDLVVFEAASEAGKGMPYRIDMNADYMLCNAFSKEIPPATRPLIDWLEKLPKRELTEWELSRHELSARAFYPRVLIGEYLADEFQRLCQLAGQRGHRVSVKLNERVSDIADSDGCVCIMTDKVNEPYLFDHVVIASGHSWPARPRIDAADLLSPWPYTAITALLPANIGILGSSLSAIDSVVALGMTHGNFTEVNGAVGWQPHDNAANLKITMVSKMGIMPEGDFYYPYPYAPLSVFTADAVDAEVEKGSDGLLQRVFDLLYKELAMSDPSYLESLGTQARNIEGFSSAYFKRRQDLGGQLAIKNDFVAVRKSQRERRTIPYRYTLLRAHENFDRALRTLNDQDWSLFSETLLPVFSDSYAAVPHLSLARVIAMFDAGVLHLVASGDEASFSNNENGGVTVEMEGETMDFDVMIDARGQASATVQELPFPSLVKILESNQESLMAPFKLNTTAPHPPSIYCLSLPQVLQRYPFCQGLSNSAENGKIVAAEIEKHI